MVFVHEVAALVGQSRSVVPGAACPVGGPGRYSTPGSSPFMMTSLAPVPLSFWTHCPWSSTYSILVVCAGQYFAGSAPGLGSQHTIGGGAG